MDLLIYERPAHALDRGHRKNPENGRN